MVRPLKQDRESVAITHVRISLATKRLIDDLRLKHGFATTDKVLRYYLPSNIAENRPAFHSAKEIYNFTKEQPDIDRLIKDVSSGLTHIINKNKAISQVILCSRL